MNKTIEDVVKLATREELEEIIIKAWDACPRTHSELNDFYSAFTHNVITLTYRVAYRATHEE